ncbi:hypothetical protein TNCV_4839431 [Trichonephila clavipes]|nr:hypothetical protein TNCV_4839431 [Trichonephila clavipes]
MKKEWSLQVELTNATAGGRCRSQQELTDPSFDKWQRHLSVARYDAGASEINRLYPESRRKDEKDRYLNSLPPQGEAGGRERPNEDETGVMSRGREGKSAGREGLTAPKRVREAPKTQWERECCIFLQPV